MPAFAALFREHKGDWNAFYREVGALAELDQEPRKRRLEELSK